MANLKVNSTYEEVSRQPGGISNNITSFLKNRGQSSFMNTSRSGYMPPSGSIKPVTGNLDVPVVPAPTERTAPIPANYSGFMPAGQYGPVGGWAPPAPGGNPQLTTLGSAYPGQYVTDPTNPQQLIKSNRGYNPVENSAILGNRPASLYQIDHIIPLWAGGADTQVNKEVLTIDKNQFKQHVQSVPLTLYAYGKIPLSQARTMALNWENVDQSNLPPLLKDSGMMKLSDAEDVYKKWNKQATETPQTSFKSVLEQVPEGLANFGEGWLPKPAQRFVQGLVSGGTFGWAQPKQDTSKDSFIDKAASVVGQFAGGFAMADLVFAAAIPAAFAAISAGGLASIRTLSALRTASQVAASESGFLKGAAVAKGAIQTAPEALGQAAPQTTGMLSKLRQVVTGKAPIAPPPPASLELPASGGIRGALETAGFKKPTLGGLAKGAGMFAAYGQMTPTGAAGALMPDTKEALGLGDVQSDPVKQFWTDIMLGTTMGFARPGLRGAAPIALPIITHSLLAGESLGDAMINAGAAVGIHTAASTNMLGQYGTKRSVKDLLGPSNLEQPSMIKAVNDAADVASINFISPWSGGAVSTIAKGGVAPGPEITTPEWINQNFQTTMTNFYRTAFGMETPAITGELPKVPTNKKQAIEGYSGTTQIPLEFKNGMDVTDFFNVRNGIITAFNQLNYRNIPEQLRGQKMIDDLLSTAHQARVAQDVAPGVSPRAIAARDTMDPALLTKAPGDLPKYAGGDLSTDLPVGIQRVTGIGVENSPKSDNVLRLHKALQAGQASPTAIITLMPELAPIFKIKNAMLTPEQLAAGYTPDMSPENFLKVEAVVWDKGQRELLDLGVMPREERIGQPGYKPDGTPIGRQNAFNHQPEIRSGDYPAYLDSFNKDALSVAMLKEGTDVLFGKWKRGGIGPGGDAPVVSGKVAMDKPFYEVVIDKPSWQAAKIFDSQLRGMNLDTHEPMTSLVSKMRSDWNGKGQPARAQQIRERQVEPASDVVEALQRGQEPGSNKEIALDSMKDNLRDAEAAITTAQSPEQFTQTLAKSTGIELIPEDAQALFDNPGATAGELFGAMNKAVDAGQTSGEATIYSTYAKGYMQSPAFNKDGVGPIVMGLKLLAAPKETTSATPTIEQSATKELTQTPQESAIPPESTPAVPNLPVSPVAQKISDLMGGPREKVTLGEGPDTMSELNVPKGVADLMQPGETVRFGKSDPGERVFAKAAATPGKPSELTGFKGYQRFFGEEPPKTSTYDQPTPGLDAEYKYPILDPKTGEPKKDASGQPYMGDITRGEPAFDPKTGERLVNDKGFPVYKDLQGNIPATESTDQYFTGLRGLREAAAANFKDSVDTLLTQPKGTYFNALGYGLRQGGQKLFKGGVPAWVIGRAVAPSGTKGNVEASNRLYNFPGFSFEPLAPKRELLGRVQPKDYLDAIGRGDQRSKEIAAKHRIEEEKQARQGQSNEGDIIPTETPSEGAMSVLGEDYLNSNPLLRKGGLPDMVGKALTPDDMRTVAGEGDTAETQQKLSVSRETGDIVDTLVQGDLELVPGFTSLMELGKPFTGNDAVRRGIEDARNILQFIMKRHNTEVSSAQKAKRRSPGNKISFIEGFKPLAEMKKETEAVFDKMYTDYFGGGMNSKITDAIKNASTQP